MAQMSKEALDKLKTQRDKLNARIHAAEARTKQSERKKETRRKILVGSYYLDQAIAQNQMDKIKQKMDAYLKRDSDRLLFDLPMLETTVSDNAMESEVKIPAKP